MTLVREPLRQLVVLLSKALVGKVMPIFFMEFLLTVKISGPDLLPGWLDSSKERFATVVQEGKKVKRNHEELFNRNAWFHQIISAIKKVYYTISTRATLQPCMSTGSAPVTGVVSLRARRASPRVSEPSLCFHILTFSKRSNHV
jgi:hypothetical protein